MKKILIIEDEADLLEMYKIQFEAEGMEVITTDDIKVGFTLVKKEKPDVVLLDLLLSQKEISEENDSRGGYLLLDQLKADPETKKIKTVVFSNLDTQKDREMAIKKGACAYLVKSETVPKELVKIVKKQCL